MKKWKCKENKIYLTKTSLWYLERMIALFHQSALCEWGFLISRRELQKELSEKKEGKAVEEEPNIKSRGPAHLQQVSCPAAWGPEESTSGAEVHHGCTDVRAPHTKCGERRHRTFHTLGVTGDTTVLPELRRLWVLSVRVGMVGEDNRDRPIVVLNQLKTTQRILLSSSSKEIRLIDWLVVHLDEENYSVLWH